MKQTDNINKLAFSNPLRFPKSFSNVEYYLDLVWLLIQTRHIYCLFPPFVIFDIDGER